VLVEFAVLLLTYLPSIVAVLVFSYHKESALFLLDYPLSSSRLTPADLIAIARIL
jgi:hypothetical protein